ncbi:MAG: glycosyltransferase family 4 protein [Caldilineaceae bacterium]
MQHSILYVNPASEISGAEVSLLLLLEGLDRSRFEPTLLVPSEGKLADKARAMGISVKVFPIYPFMIEKNLVHSVYDALLSITKLHKIYQLYKTVQPDLVHINSYRIGIPFSLVARILNIPSIWHIRDIPTQSAKRKLVGRVSSIADEVIGISCAVVDSLEIKHKKNVHVIYNGVDFSQFDTIKPGKFRSELCLAPDTLLIVSIGQLIPLKGHDLLIKAFSKVVQQRNIHLVIVGGEIAKIGHGSSNETSYPLRLKQMVSDLGLLDSVTFTGFRSDIPQILTDADLYVHASTSPEGFGRVLVEAMAAGKAVIAPNWGGSVEIVDPEVNGFLFDPCNLEDLVNRLSYCIQHHETLHLVGETGKRSVLPKFSSHLHIANVQKIYHQMTAVE